MRRFTFRRLAPLTRGGVVWPAAHNVPCQVRTSALVADIREGSAHAIAVQRQPPKVKTVVAIDAFGEIADMMPRAVPPGP